MLTQEQKDRYYRDGYLLVPNVLTREQVKWLRAFFRPKFDLPAEQRPSTDTENWLVDVFSRYPELRWLYFHERTLGIVKSLLGEDFLLHAFEGTAHLNWFGGWHKDTGSPEAQGYTFFFEKDYESLTAAFYLQDNSPDYGGGLDVEPGSHREPDRFFYPGPPPQRSLLTRIWHQIDRSARREYWLAYESRENWKRHEPTNVVSVPSKAGDLVLIDSRVNHHGTPSRKLMMEGFIPRGILSPEQEKVAIFFGCSRNTAPARAYWNYVKGRKDYPYLADYSYPDDLLRDANQAGVNLLGPQVSGRLQSPAHCASQ
jgi:hypothetical protein